MKMIIAIVQDQDATVLRQALVEASIRATKLSSTGGFLREGNTTFLIGVPDDELDKTLDVIKKNCSARTQLTLQPGMVDSLGVAPVSVPFEVAVGGATVFVLPIEQFEQY